MRPRDELPTTITLLDGGTGRELMRIGAPFRQPEWSALALIEAPEFVSRVHEAYVAAGADVITTNSYAVVPFHLGAERFAAEGAKLAALAGRLARQAADAAGHRIAVAGSLPPICGSYRPDLFDAKIARPVLATLVAALRPSIDHWQAETLSTIEEAELVREVLGQDGKPLWLSFTLSDDAALGAPRLRSGQPVAQATVAALRLGAEAVLFNCSQPEVMEDAVKAAVEVRDTLPRRGTAPLRIGVYANAFPAQREDALANATLHEMRELTPARYVRFARGWLARGARIVGGCCGIGPQHIAALRAVVHPQGTVGV
jgi:S-methylmethionine-dependent homocysteine/selenocysteine methylase